MMSKWMFLLLATAVMSELSSDFDYKHVSRSIVRLSDGDFIGFVLFVDRSGRATFSTDQGGLEAARILRQARLHGWTALSGEADLLLLCCFFCLNFAKLNVLINSQFTAI